VVWVLIKWLRTCASGGAAYAIGLVAGSPPEVQLPAVFMSAMLGYATAELGIRRAIGRRQALIIGELPETLDLLTISVEAGLGLDQALAVVTSRRSGPLSEEIRTYLDEVRLGSDRHEALKAIGTRTGVEDLVSFTATVVQAMEFGVSIAQVLRIQADAVRTRRRQRIEERAMKAPVKMLFPLIVLILPSLFVVAAGPGLIRAYTEFISPTGSGQFAPPSAPGR
ncbi:MAG: type II secretion system F family protein, partial [Armatimonadetes bacterium]|nr:type II secretion system F family protein [Armatimonadota bacterium]